MRSCAVALLSALALFAAVGCDSAAPLSPIPACTVAVPLTTAEVETIIAQAAARATVDGQAYLIYVTNREGVVVGAFSMDGAPVTEEDPRLGTVALRFTCRAKARTAAFLSSNQHAFNTRTARFIIQDNFPPGINNAPGGPLYGVQFSNLTCSDVIGEALSGAAKLFSQEGNGLLDDTGSMPLYRDGCLVGAVAVEGFPEGIIGPDVIADDRFEERAAWSAAGGFRPVEAIFGSQIHIDGVRLDFMEEMPLDDDLVVVPYASLVGIEITPPMDAPPEQVFLMGVFGGLDCEIRYPLIDSPRAVPVSEKLVAADIAAMFQAGAARSAITRAGIRRPLGTPMRCFISVVDLDGTILGSIRTPEATLFSFDVSIQKARTSAFFSTDSVAFSCRAMGFMAQGFFPPGILAAPRGPLSNEAHLIAGAFPLPGQVLALQDALSVPLFFGPGGVCEPPIVTELANGITVFPGGVPVYKGGRLVGAIGVSGDGVDQDDFIAQAGGELFPPPAGVRCDEVAESLAVATLRARIDVIRTRAAAIVAPPALVAAAMEVVDACLAADANYAAIGLKRSACGGGGAW